MLLEGDMFACKDCGVIPKESLEDQGMENPEVGDDCPFCGNTLSIIHYGDYLL